MSPAPLTLSATVRLMLCDPSMFTDRTLMSSAPGDTSMMSTEFDDTNGKSVHGPPFSRQLTR